MRYFRSDDHLGHKNITRYEAAARPFGNDLEAMFICLRDRHNSLVAPSDDVYHGGDLGWTDAWIERYLAEFNGNHTLTSGNHDESFQLRSKAAKARRRLIRMGFVDVVDGLELTLSDGTEVLMSHFPYYGDHTMTERFMEVRPRDDGKPLIHGHVHSMWQTLDHMVNVGVDAWDLYPVSEDQIVALLAEQRAAA